MNLINILEKVPTGTKLYCPLYGEVIFVRVNTDNNNDYPILVELSNGCSEHFTSDGKLYSDDEFSESECMLFPSKDKRVWDTV